MLGCFRDRSQLGLTHHRIGRHLEQRRLSHLSVLVASETLIIMLLPSCSRTIQHANSGILLLLSGGYDLCAACLGHNPLAQDVLLLPLLLQLPELGQLLVHQVGFLKLANDLT